MQPCGICNHAERRAIEAELPPPWKASLRDIAAKYGVSKDAIHRHHHKCMGVAAGVRYRRPKKTNQAPVVSGPGGKQTEDAGASKYLTILECFRMGPRTVGELRDMPALVGMTVERREELLNGAGARGYLWLNKRGYPDSEAAMWEIGLTVDGRARLTSARGR